MTGNTIHVQLRLLLRVGNLTVKYDDIQKYTRQYRVFIRRAKDNWTVRGVSGPCAVPICHVQCRSS